MDIHPASPDELVAAHRNVFDIWSLGRPLDEHLRYRLNSPSHSRARWYVGTLDGRVVVSLGCYPIAFRVHDQRVPGIAIGSVYTLGEFRGRGFAPRLLDWVEREEQASRDAAWSVLYSDINPSYYERLGYTLCPSWLGWCEPRKAAANLTTELRLTLIAPADRLGELERLYAEYHGAMPLSIARDRDYWGAILKKFASDKFYALADSAGRWLGYVRVGSKEDAWRITDFALADQSEDLAEQLYVVLASLAAQADVVRFGGWLPDSPAARKFFALEPRPAEITMIKPLRPTGGGRPLDAALVAGTTRFCEIDHV